MFKIIKTQKKTPFFNIKTFDENLVINTTIIAIKKVNSG